MQYLNNNYKSNRVIMFSHVKASVAKLTRNLNKSVQFHIPRDVCRDGREHVNKNIRFLYWESRSFESQRRIKWYLSTSLYPWNLRGRGNLSQLYRRIRYLYMINGKRERRANLPHKNVYIIVIHKYHTAKYTVAV